jgi:hypothetical protein
VRVEDATGWGGGHFRLAILTHIDASAECKRHEDWENDDPAGQSPATVSGSAMTSSTPGVTVWSRVSCRPARSSDSFRYPNRARWIAHDSDTWLVLPFQIQPCGCRAFDGANGDAGIHIG